MKYLIINGSPRKQNTYNAIEMVKNNIDGEFGEINLLNEEIPMCIGCQNCIMKGEEKCPHFDKINPIIQKINECDGLIISSPVYAMNVTDYNTKINSFISDSRWKNGISWGYSR